MIAAHGLERFVSDVIIEGSLGDTTSHTSGRMTGRMTVIARVSGRRLWTVARSRPATFFSTSTMNDATVVLGRECGKCSMCCQHMEIKELAKPFGPGAHMYVKENRCAVDAQQHWLDRRESVFCTTNRLDLSPCWMFRLRRLAAAVGRHITSPLLP